MFSTQQDSNVLYMSLNPDALSRKNFCLGKAMCYVFLVYVFILSYPAYKTHASCYTVIFGLSSCITFFHIIL
jgi:hypothetical protein